MLFPFRDDNPTRITPVVTIAFIVANVLVFLYQLSLPGRAGEAFIYMFGMIPAVLFGSAQLPPELAVLPGWATIFSSMFLHGGIMHIAGNMLFLWVFGNNVEDAMGHGRFVAFYLLCGIAAALAQGFSDTTSQIPMIGASGAISGVLGAYLILHPRAEVLSLLFLGFFVRIIALPAMFVLGIWFLLQLVQATLMRSEGEGGVAFLAHIGGFIAGAVLVPLFRNQAAVEWQAHERLEHGPWQPRRGPRERRSPWDRRGPWG
ncbi:MAG TPA: rhomboid family intramembrane serine protease [Alphaproteobacteria bacterium]|nr:rhomboid family intramembrane serine protease [Alphaproteobacteria bacterium]